MFELPKLPYAYDALEPVIDARTMELHHGKHHAAYIEKLNAALQKHPELIGKPVEELLRSPGTMPEDIRGAVRNHGGGHANHSLFWNVMSPPAGGDGARPKGNVAEALARDLGGFEVFKKLFAEKAMGQFGSGWAWLSKDAAGTLKAYALPNQDSPLSQGDTPLLGLDVWEHAYYLKYQNRRAEYVENWWNIVNWEEVERNFNT